MKCFEEELYEYIYDLCLAKGISIDYRFRCYGDMNEYWSSKTNSCFKLDCKNSYTGNIEDVKDFVIHNINELWEQATQPNHRIALYVHNIIVDGEQIEIIMGSCLFEDDALL